MAKNLNMQMTITADASQAKREMRTLQEQLNKLGSQSSVGKGVGESFTKEFQKAQREVAELQVNLQKAFNVDTGKLDFTQFNQQLKQSGKTLEDYGASLVKLGPEGQQAFLNLTKAVSSAEVPILRVNNAIKEMGTVLKNTIKWQISSTAIHGFMGAVQQAYGYAQNLNESLNNIRIVTGLDTQAMAQFADQANRAAQALSTSTLDYTDAALIYYQQGIRDQEEIAARTETTLKLANVTKASAEEVSSQMTAIWNNFYDGSESLESYADKITALGAATASSSAEIAQGLEKFAAVADTVGLSYDQATAALATVVAQTRQSADVVGTAFKTLFARLEGLKLGETLEDGTTVNQYSAALEKVGVNIFQANGQLKDMDDILDDLGDKWQTLDKNSKVALAQTVGGMRQYNQLIALMDNYDKFQDNLKVAQEAEGTLQQQQNIYAESWEAAIKRVKAAWESLYTDIIEDKTFIELTNNAAKLIQALDDIIDRMGGIKGVIVQILPLIGQLYSKEISSMMSNVGNTARMLIPGQRDKMLVERDAFVNKGLEKAKSSLGENTAEYQKYESQIKYNEALSKYQNQLTQSDKDYLDILNKQNQARTEELQIIQEEVKLLEKRNEESKKDFLRNGIVEGITGNDRQQIIDIKDRYSLSQGAASMLNSSLSSSQEIQVKNLQDYLLKNQSELSQQYSVGGMGQGPQGIYAQLNKMIDEYFQEFDKEDHDPSKTSEIYNKIENLIEVYIGNATDEKGQNKGDEIRQKIETKIGEIVESSLTGLNKNITTAQKDSSNAITEMNSLGLNLSSKLVYSEEELKIEIDKYLQDLKGSGAEQEEITEKEKELKLALKTYKDAQEAENKATEELAQKKEEQARKVTDQASSEADEIAQSALKKAEEEKRIAEIKANTEKIKQEAEQRARDAIANAGTAERITAVTTAVTSLNAIVNTTSSALETLFDKSATPAEKFKAILQSTITVLMQVANLSRGNTLALVKDTFIVNANTVAEQANTQATKENTASKEKNGIASNVEAQGKEQSTMANAANTVAKKKGKLALWDAEAGATTSLGSAAVVIVAILAAVKTFTWIIDKFQESHDKLLENLKQENEEIAKWREENDAALEAAHNYDILNTKLKNNIITQKDYNESLEETAKQLGIANAEILAQAGAYDILNRKIKQASADLEEEELDKAIQSDINARNLMAAGDDDMLQAAMNTGVMKYNPYTAPIAAVYNGIQYLRGDYNNFGDTTKSVGRGAWLEAGEAALINDLKNLNISGVNVSDRGDISWDTASMSTSDLAKFSQFIAEATTNSSKYGGDSNELIENLKKMNENWAETASQFQTAAETENRGEIEWFLENNESAKNALNAGEKGYAALLNVLGEEFGEETARAVLSGYFEEAEILKAETINEFTKSYGFEEGSVFAALEESGSNANLALEAMAKNSDLLAAGLYATGGSFEDLTEFMQYCIDSVDLTNFGDQLASIQKLVDSLNFGDLISEDNYKALVEQFGEEALKAYVAVLPNGEQRVINDISDLENVAVQTATDLIDKYRSDNNQANVVQEQIDNFSWSHGRNLEETESELSRIQNVQEQSQNTLDLGQIVLNNSETLHGKTYHNKSSLAEDLGVSEDKITDEFIKTYFGGDQETGWSMKGTAEGAEIENINAGLEEEINNRQENIDAIQSEVDAYSLLLTTEEKLQELKKDPYALEDDLVNASTTMEQLQKYYTDGYVSTTKYLDSLDVAAVRTAEALDLDKEALLEQAKQLKANNAAVKGNMDQAMQLALAYQRQSAALTDLNSNIDTYIEQINNSEVGSQEYSSALNSLEQDMQNLFNTDESIGEGFILEHLEDIQKAAENDEDAVKRLQTAYAMMITSSDFDFTKEELTEVQDLMNQIAWSDLEIGVGVDTQPALQALWDFYEEALNSGKITEEQLHEIWNGMGYELEPIWGTERVQTHAPADVVAARQALEYIDRPVIVGYQPKYSGNAKATTSTPKSSSKGKSGSSRSKKDKKDYEDEYERYYTINRQIQDQIDEVERLGKAKDRAWGKAKLDLLDKESDALQTQIDLQNEKIRQVEEYYKYDQERLNFFGAQYDENGVLTNYDEIVKREVDAYNKAVDRYNNGGGEGAFSLAEDRYNKFKEILKQYDETNQLWQSEMDKLTDLKNEYYDMQLEKIQTKVEMDIEVDDSDLKVLEYELDRIRKKAFSTAEAIAKIGEQLDVNLDKQKVYNDALEDILANHGISDIGEINNLDESTIANLGFTQDEIKALEEYNENLLETQEELNQLEEDILNGPVEAFKEWNDEFDYQEDKIENNINLLKQYKNIADLIYSNSRGVTDQFLYGIMNNTYNNMVTGVGAAYTEWQANKAALAEAMAAYEESIAAGADEQTITLLRNNLREMEGMVDKSRDDMLKKTEEALKQAEDLLKQFVENAAKAAKEAFSATEWDMTKFDRLKTLDDEYLDDYEKIYELSKLTRDVNNSMDSIDTIRGKERLKEITQEIAEIEESNKEISQYEVDALRKKYELRLAEIALEDAQAAKNTVRMSRDNDGNWSYVYTADDSKVDKARQNYEDKLYEYQKLNSEFIKNQQENFLKLEQEYTDAMQKIAEDSSLNEEDKLTRLQETQAYYQRMAEIMTDQLGIALDRNSELYHKDWLDFSKMTDYKISKLEDYQTQIEFTYTGYLQPNIESAMDLLTQFTNATVGEGGYFPQIVQGLEEFKDRQDEILHAAGTTLEDYAMYVEDAMYAAGESSVKASEEVSYAANNMREAFDQVIAKINELNQKNLSNLRSDITSTVKSINNLIGAYKELSQEAQKSQQAMQSAIATAQEFYAKTNKDNSTRNTTNQDTSTAPATTSYNFSQMQTFYDKIVKITNGNKSMQKDVLIGIFNDTDWNTIKLKATNDPTKIKDQREGANRWYPNIYKLYPFDTGGYTGSWGSEGRLAMLHQKELVLNAHDTENMLNTIQMVRDIVASIDTRAAAAGAMNINAGYAGSASAGTPDLNQNVHIEASFPNVTDHNEIELALTNLVNRASQYAGRKKP